MRPMATGTRHGVSALFVVVAALVLLLIAGTVVHTVFFAGSNSATKDLENSSGKAEKDADRARGEIQDYLDRAFIGGGSGGSDDEDTE